MKNRLRCFNKKSLCLVFAIMVTLSWAELLFAKNTTVEPFSLTGQFSQLSREDLREIFFGRRTQWPDGTPMRVFVLPDDDPVHVRFAKEVLGIYPYQLRSAWDRMVYSGTGVPPVVVDSLEQMQNQLQKTPGSIGYVEK